MPTQLFMRLLLLCLSFLLLSSFFSCAGKEPKRANEGSAVPPLTADAFAETTEGDAVKARYERLLQRLDSLAASNDPDAKAFLQSPALRNMKTQIRFNLARPNPSAADRQRTKDLLKQMELLMQPVLR